MFIATVGPLRFKFERKNKTRCGLIHRLKGLRKQEVDEQKQMFLFKKHDRYKKD